MVIRVVKLYLSIERSRGPAKSHQRPLRPLRDRLRSVSARRAGVQGPCRLSPGAGELGVL